MNINHDGPGGPLPICCGPCWFGKPKRLTRAVATIGGDTLCEDHLDGYCARADLQLDALEEWAP